MEFRVSGKTFNLDEAQVTAALKKVTPETARTHVVEVGGKWFPVKQALAAVTKMDRLDFTTAQARAVLQRLGFKTFRAS